MIIFRSRLTSGLTPKVTSKLTPSGTPFSLLLAGLKGKKGVRRFHYCKIRGRHQSKEKRGEREAKQRTQMRL